MGDTNDNSKPDKKQESGDKVCYRCGQAAIIEIGDSWYCADCYHECGSCCLEFGANDLWDKPDNIRPDSKKDKK
jgi:hypothetical protein